MTEENGKRLTQEQRLQVLQWLAEGLESPEIAARAAAAVPPFTIARSTLSHYRATRQIEATPARIAIQAQAEGAALNAGYLTAAQRVEKLSRLADQLEADLTTGGKLWTHNVKSIGKGNDFERIEYEEFNAAEVREYRGILDDIARETGGRIAKFAGAVDVEIIWDLPVPGWEPPSSQPSASA